MESMKVSAGLVRLLPPGECAHVEIGGQSVALVNHEGAIHAFDGHCPHAGGPLGQGGFVDGHIVCPWHAWAFNAEDGTLDVNPAVKLTRYAVSVEDGGIFVELPG